jgi:hypothetical protein
MGGLSEPFLSSAATHDLAAEVVLDLEIDSVEQVQRDVLVLDERRVQDRAGLRTVGDPLVGLAVDPGGPVFEQRNDDAVFAFFDEGA